MRRRIPDRRARSAIIPSERAYSHPMFTRYILAVAEVPRAELEHREEIEGMFKTVGGYQVVTRVREGDGEKIRIRATYADAVNPEGANFRWLKVQDSQSSVTVERPVHQRALLPQDLADRVDEIMGERQPRVLDRGTENYLKEQESLKTVPINGSGVYVTRKKFL